MANIKCCKCYAEIPDSSVFCMKCGAKQSPDVEELIDLINNKFLSKTNQSFSANRRLGCEKWINEFGFDEVCCGVEISIQQYLRFDEENNPIKATVNEVFCKISGICANRKNAKENPYISDALKAFNYANKKFRIPSYKEKEIKEHIERIFCLYYEKNDNYKDLCKDFSWKMKKIDDRNVFFDEIQKITNDLEKDNTVSYIEIEESFFAELDTDHF